MRHFQPKGMCTYRYYCFKKRCYSACLFYKEVDMNLPVCEIQGKIKVYESVIEAMLVLRNDLLEDGILRSTRMPSGKEEKDDLSLIALDIAILDKAWIIAEREMSKLRKSIEDA